MFQVVVLVVVCGIAAVLMGASPFTSLDVLRRYSLQQL
jgi:hypothetical protein